MDAAELAAFRDGDEVVFRDLVERHSPRLLAIARPFAGTPDDIHDLVQETWVRAFEHRRSFAGRGPVLSWLCTICRNVCLSSARPAAGAAVRASGSLADALPDSASAPDLSAERDQLGRGIMTALLELPERQRSVVILRLLEGRSTRETARALECAEGTVKATLHHALARLRPRLAAWAAKP